VLEAWHRLSLDFVYFFFIEERDSIKIEIIEKSERDVENLGRR
jgi:hypothetical protein